jgi:hypothetical protein
MGGDPAQINRSSGTIRTELEFLVNSGMLSPPQFQSIQAQLPVCLLSLSLVLSTWLSSSLLSPFMFCIFACSKTCGEDVNTEVGRKVQEREKVEHVNKILATKRPTLTLCRFKLRRWCESV